MIFNCDMKPFHIIIYCIITPLCLISCNHKQSVLDFNDFDVLPSVSFEDIFEPLTFIPLQTNDSSIISNILKVCMSDDSFYIFSVNPYKINKYSLNGSFISTISREGKAEGEYLVPSDIFYNEQDSTLFIDDAVKGIIMYKSDGSYISTIPLEVRNRRFVVSESGSIIINDLNMLGREKYSLVDISRDKDTLFIVPNHHKFECKNVFYLPTHPSFKMNDDELLFNPACNDTIFSYSSNNLVPKYILNFPHPVTDSDLLDFNKNMSDTQFLMDYAEDDINLYLTIFDRDWDYKQYMMRKDSKDVHRAHFRISDEFNTEFSPRWQYGNILIDVFDPATLNYTYYKDITEEDSRKAFDYLSQNGVSGINEDSNPIIMLARAKK